MSTSIFQFNDLRIPLEKILNATNNFSEENIIGKGGFGNVYKGQLVHSGELINVTARRLDPSQGQGDMEFWTEISVVSCLEHPNIVSLIGFCDEKGEKIIINRDEDKGSLCMYLDNPALTWIRRLRIVLGIANAISYLHYEKGRDYSIIHRNINSSTILLDDNFEAKLSGFEFSIKGSLDRKERYTSSEVIGTQGYVDPETLENGDVTQKSDIYSFGVVICEILCGRKAFLPYESEDNNFLTPIMWNHYDNNTLENIIIPDMWNQMGPESCLSLASCALSCLATDVGSRSDIDVILHCYNFHLELHSRTVTPLQHWYNKLGETLKSAGERMKFMFTAHVNDALQPLLEVFTTESTSSNTWKVNKLDHLRIGLIEIQSATKNFSKEYEIWTPNDSYGTVYGGDLEWFDKKYVSSLEGKNKGELPKRHYNVRIKCITDATAVDMFYKEIEILSNCKHDNIDSLLGFCDEGSHMILVYEGNTYFRLLEYLSAQVLTWDMRLKICLDVAHGLNYLHNDMEDQKMVIHRQLSSYCIMCDGNWQGTKITEFGVSTFRENQDEDALIDYYRRHQLTLPGLCSVAPEILETGKATKESDVYSFGLVMFEILCGMPYAFVRISDAKFPIEDGFKYGTIKQMVSYAVKEDKYDNKLFLKKGPNEDSLDTFIKINEQCLAVNPEQRPTLQVIIVELEKALRFQDKHKDALRMSFKDIETATQNFSRANDIGGGGFGRVYKGKLASEHGSSTIVAKRLDTRRGQGDQQFYNELHILSEYKHENVIRLVGYNNDKQERIIVYEYASKGSLDKFLNDASLTWINRLNICIDIASGLAFLHAGVREHEAVIHRDLKPANILLFDDRKAKVADFGLSLICTINDETNYVIDHPCGTKGYLDPLYQESRILTKESDIYSFGVLLLEILCGRTTFAVYEQEGQFLQNLLKQLFEEGRLDDVVFNAIKNQIVPKALATFLEVAFQCLDNDREKRPTTQQVLVQLQKALELQVKGLIGIQGILEMARNPGLMLILQRAKLSR